MVLSRPSLGKTAITVLRAPRDGVTTQQFLWQGIDKRGVIMRGEQVSKSANLLRAQLRSQGITPTLVRIKPKPLFGGRGSRIKPKDIAMFSRQLATMMASGVPLITTLEIIANGQKNLTMKRLVDDLRLAIAGGASIYEALGKHPAQFDSLYRNLVRAGESAGALETILGTIATYRENAEGIKSKIRKALFYPVTIVVVAVIVCAILLIFVVPTFRESFQSYGTQLPAFTELVFGISAWAVEYGWAALLAVVAAAMILVFAHRRSARLRDSTDELLLKLPIAGAILGATAVARFARTLAVSLKAGMPLVQAMDSVAGATGNRVYQRSILRMREDIAAGYSMEVAMKQVCLFPPMMLQMTAIGEEAGALDSMLFKVAEFYEQTVDDTIDTLEGLIEPLVMVIIGSLVGAIVVAMYLPIFKLAMTIS